MAMGKINVTMPQELLERLEEYSTKNYMPKSTIISVATNQYLQAQEVFGLIGRMSLAFEKIADRSDITPDVMEELDDLMRISQLLLSGKK